VIPVNKNRYFYYPDIKILTAKTTIAEAELVELLKSGAANAMTVLYENYSAALYGVILNIVGSEEAAEDIMQEAFIKIWKNFDKYDKTKGRLFTWLINVARNTAIDSLRVKDYETKKQIRSLDNSVRSINSQHKVYPKTDTIGLKQIVDKLKPEYKILIDKLYFEGYTQEEASKELNIPLGTVKTRIRTAMNLLRDILK
jgi:RNA polymerase sigma-70 factor (ECF subfamily)